MVREDAAPTRARKFAAKSARPFHCLGFDDGQLDNKSSASRHVVLHEDLSVVLKNDGVHDGKSQPRAVLILRKIGIEIPSLVFVGDAPACVRHLDDARPWLSCRTAW